MLGVGAEGRRACTLRPGTPNPPFTSTPLTLSLASPQVAAVVVLRRRQKKRRQQRALDLPDAVPLSAMQDGTYDPPTQYREQHSYPTRPQGDTFVPQGGPGQDWGLGG